MPRLPIPGSDGGKWGKLLNEYLEVSHNSDGSIKTSSVPAGATGATGPTGAAGGAGFTGATGPAGTTDHGNLVGLADDDHAQYALADGTRGSFSVVLIWDDVSDYIPNTLKASDQPKEFRGPVDPSGVSGVVLNEYDTWISTA